MDRPDHPGVALADFIVPFGISQNALARRMGVPPRRINAIVLGKRSITADTAVGLAEALGVHELFWMRLQAEYDVAIARARRAERPEVPRRAFRSDPWNECDWDEDDPVDWTAADLKDQTELANRVRAWDWSREGGMSRSATGWKTPRRRR